MKNFARALRDGLIYWRSLVLATLCSLGVAALWGANIGALYPIVEVTFGGESLQHWMARELAKSQQTIQDLDTALAQLDPRSPDLAVQAQIARLENRREAEEHSMHRTRLMRPWIERYVPDDPLQTVILVVAALLVGTLIKHALLLANTYLVAYVSNSIAQDIRRRIFKQAVYMDRAGFGTYGTSGFSANLTHTADMLTTGITNVFGGAIREPLKLLSCLIGAALICWRLLLVSMIVVPVVAGLIVMLSYHIKLACRLLLQRSMGFHHVMHEAFGNMQTVQAYNMQEEERRRFAWPRTRCWSFPSARKCLTP